VFEKLGGSETSLELVEGLVSCWTPHKPTVTTLEERGERNGDGAETKECEFLSEGTV
jgi:hypothetical protein